MLEVLEIVLTPQIWAPPKSGALGWSLYSLMVNLRLQFATNLYNFRVMQLLVNLMFPSEPRQ